MLNGSRVSYERDGNVLEQVRDGGCTALEMH